jgi:N-succinyldiaminopimelate aminotransferase
MNPRLSLLQPYPFEKLRDLFAGVTPAAVPAIRLSIGEPQHPTPAFIRDALVAHLDGLSVYPTTAGDDRLRAAMAAWFRRRFQLARLDPATDVLPVNGSREALFAIAQTVIDASRPSPLVACPNPFYQIYEGAALLAGANPVFFNQTAANGFGIDLDAIAPSEWERVQLLYVCSPGNPAGRVITLDEWKTIFEFSDRYGFVVASDECYSEIYFDEQAPPIGALQAAARLGRDDYRNLIVFTSLSKRSNVPGLRSGGVAGDAHLMRAFLAYRTYHGSAMGPSAQEASIAAWHDEAHVLDNRDRYRAKFDAALELLSPVLNVSRPDGGFYLWAGTPEDDAMFAKELYRATNVTVLAGQYLGREAHGINPGLGYVRIALVPDYDACLQAVERIASFCRSRY